METVEPGAGSELAQPLPTSSLKPPNILVLTPPGWGQGHCGQLNPTCFPVCCWESIPSLDPLGDLQVSGKGAITGLQLGRPSPSSAGTSSALSVQCLPGQRWAGRRFPRVEKGLRAWLMSTERLGAHHFSFPGLHPPARPRGTPRKYQLPGPGKAGPTWVEVRLGSPHQAIGARSPKTSTRAWQDFKGPFGHHSS